MDQTDALRTAPASAGLALFQPKGVVATGERNLIVTAVLLMLLLVVPVVAAAFIIAYKFRAGNQRAAYDPNWDHNKFLQSLWWGLPALVILCLSVLTWRGAHDLEPSKPLQSSLPPLVVQVVALRWKWLFIYPEQKVATLNFVEFPENRPVRFELTADAPMNSFWIPQLGGQMYAMAGMVNNLYLMASQTGEFTGGAAEINGRGFSSMKFTAKAVTASDFSVWLAAAKQSPRGLPWSDYLKLTQPSENDPPAVYSWYEPGLYNKIVAQFMAPAAGSGEPQLIMPGM
ncbi:MAG: COX aromatic rich motif-containing protein [Patescibacteria group bacterium]|nr:COX aromatic rich motif-containing protein [Patescibacteria group bacterium]